MERKIQGKNEQDRSKICWKEVENKKLKGNLIIWCQYRYNIEKWIFGKLEVLNF